MNDTDPKIREEPDGTVTIMPDDFFDLVEPIKGLSSRELAQRVIEALRDAERAGALHYAECEL